MDAPTPDNRDRTPEPGMEGTLGGADSVPNTTTLGDASGTDPNARRDPAGSGVGPGVHPGGGPHPIVWVTGILAVIAALAYVLGVF